MNGHPVTFSGNGSGYSGYLCESGSGPGVIVIQEWWGLVGHIRSVADRFAGAGFVALAPDFYHGRSTTEPDEAGSMMMALEIDDVAQVIRGAIDTLLTHPSVEGDKVGVVGFCMGGQLSMYAACIDTRVGACVNFYGIHPNVKPDFAQLRAPILGFFAEYDEYASPQMVEQLDQDLSALGKRHSFQTFAETHHAFFNNERPEVYDAESAEACWNTMTSFLHEELRT
ncbi:MAG: dienelactone hydrolase family protein [Chthonomonadaceae bacterium]|nr:dienelactone hydrolase family protein [Chthonomonadaceae bacterium]